MSRASASGREKLLRCFQVGGSGVVSPSGFNVGSVWLVVVTGFQVFQVQARIVLIFVVHDVSHHHSERLPRQPEHLPRSRIELLIKVPGEASLGLPGPSVD